MSAPVRVLIPAPAPLGEGRIGGIANFIHGFIRYMPDDFAVEVVGVAVGDDTPDDGWQTISLAGRDVRFLPVARIPTARRSGRIPVKARIVAGILLRRRRVATAGRVAQVHAPAMDLGLLGRSVPTVRVVHNAPADLAGNRAESTWRRIGWGLHMVERLTFRRADRVYFVNRDTYDEYAARSAARAERLRYLPNFVDPSVFQPPAADRRADLRAAAAAELGIPANGRWLVFAGRLDPQKDPLLAMRAFAAASAAAVGAGEPGARLLVAGDGGLRAEAEGLAADLGIASVVHFLGTIAQDRLARLMAVADAFLLSSAFEAGPTVAYEALAAGLPVVGTRVGEMAGLIEHERTGWLAAERSPDALAAGIDWALAQERSALAEQCASSMEPYHLEAVLRPFYEEHRRLAHAHARGAGLL